ncbi:MAG: branched-chain amino acid aminotransferase, partial [Alphaproteobacteria bacterium]
MVVVRAFMPVELAMAVEVFLTGSAAVVTPVGEIVGHYGHYRFTPGRLCRLLWEVYDRAVGKQLAAA